MNLMDIKSLTEVSKENNIPVPTLKGRLKLKSFEMIENVDYRRMGLGQSIILSPTGVEKILNKKINK